MIIRYESMRINKLLFKEYMRELRKTMEYVGGEGDVQRELERFANVFAKYIGVKYAIALNSGTDALQLSLTILGIKEGDEVIIPNLTYPVVGYVVKYVGAKPVLIDVSQEYLSIDIRQIEKHINKNLAIEHIQLGENITIKKFIEIISSYPKIDRLVIDNVNKLLMFAESKKYYRIHLAELVRHLRNIGCSLILCETSGDNIDSGNDEAFEVDGVMHIMFLELEEKPMRALSIHKLRYASFEPKIPHELIISENGIELTETRII